MDGARKITGEQLDTLVFARNKAAGTDAVSSILLDEEYDALPRSVWESLITELDLSTIHYMAEERDCDDYAKGLAGLLSLRHGVNGCAVVIDRGNDHAYCMVLVDGGDKGLSLAIVEPQDTGTPWRDGQAEPYTLVYGMMIW